MTDEEKRLEAEFEKLRDNAEKENKSFSGTLGNMVDIHYFYTLSAVYKIKSLGGLNEEKLKKHLNELKNRFTADKRVHLRTLEIQKETHERRMKCSRALTELVKNADNLSLAELLGKFVELVENGFDSISATKIKEKLTKRHDFVSERHDFVSETLIAKDEGEGYVIELLQSLRKEMTSDFAKRYTYVEVQEMLGEAKENGSSRRGCFKITHEGENFSVYRI